MRLRFACAPRREQALRLLRWSTIPAIARSAAAPRRYHAYSVYHLVARLTAAVAVVKLKRTSTAGVTQQSMPTRPERSPSPIPNLWEPCLKSFSPISLLPSETEPRDNQPCHSQEHSYQEQCPCAGSDMKARFSHAEPPSMRKRSRSSTLRS